ncbi:MAG: TldD/PmbA family protein [Deltaproteobacteria bacterium]|nr:TldD/PmbA family protein [Deltaproteobacteria bacterium]
MRARQEVLRILETTLSLASEGVDEAEVALAGGELGVTRFVDNQIQPAAERSTETISVRLRAKGQIVRASTTDMSTSGIKQMVTQTRATLGRLPEAKIPAPSFPSPQSYVEIEAYDPEIEMMRSLERAAIVGRAIVEAHKAHLSASGVMMVRRGSIGFEGTLVPYALANTRGLLAYHPETRAAFRVRMLSKRGVTGFAEAESCLAEALSIERLVSIARDRATVAGNPRVLAPGDYEAVLEPAAVAALLRPLASTCGASSYHAGSSFLSGRLGELIVGPEITLVDDFANPLHRGCPFDVEGVAKQPVTIIEAGVARSPVRSWSSSLVFDSSMPTGHQVRDGEFGDYEGAQHLVLRGGDQTLADLIANVKDGVLVTRLSEVQIVDAPTLRVFGMTRGVLEVKGGEVVGPAKDLAFEIGVLDLLKRVEGLTNEVWADGSVVPAMRVRGFRLAASS